MKPALLLSLLMMSTNALFAEHPASQPVPREAQWCLDHHTLLNQKAKKGGFEVILLGDSITWEWEANKETGLPVWPKLAPLKAATFGVSGDRTEHLLWRLQNGNLEIAEAPKAAVLMIGTNNLGQRKDPPEAIADGVTLILKEIRQRFPDCALYIYGIFPRGHNSEAEIRKNLMATNVLLQKVAEANDAKYIDLSAEYLLPDGKLNETAYRDGVHLSEKGYEIWATSLLKEVTPEK